MAFTLLKDFNGNRTNFMVPALHVLNVSDTSEGALNVTDANSMLTTDNGLYGVRVNLKNISNGPMASTTDRWAVLFNLSNGDKYGIQICILYENNSSIYIRHLLNGTFGSWNEFKPS